MFKFVSFILLRQLKYIFKEQDRLVVFNPNIYIKVYYE